MFLDILRRRNRSLIEQAIALHQAGAIPANTYVIDLDAVAGNAVLMRAEADKAGLKIFAMTKQMGRNGDFCRAVKAGGIDKAVAVDMECARACARAGLGIGHLGHLVQIPRHEAPAAEALSPDFWTVFNLEKAREAASAARHRGRRQALLARIHAAGDRFYTGHEGGFPAEDIVAVADTFDRLEGGGFAGITTFPALLFEEAGGTIGPTPNLGTLARAVEALHKAGRRDIEVNAPGTTSSVTIRQLADHGATQCEPGHGLTGTTPLHALRDLPEVPAVCYVSEVSHLHAGRAYCFRRRPLCRPGLLRLRDAGRGGPGPRGGVGTAPDGRHPAARRHRLLRDDRGVGARRPTGGRYGGVRLPAPGLRDPRLDLGPVGPAHRSPPRPCAP